MVGLSTRDGEFSDRNVVLLRGGKLTFRTRDTSHVRPPQQRRNIFVYEADPPSLESYIPKVTG